MFNLLGAEKLVADWVADSFPIIKFIILALIFISAVSLIVIILMQETDGGNGTNAITGIKDTYYSQNKGSNREGRLKKLTIVLSTFIAVAVVVFFILTAIYPNSIWS